MKDNFSSSFTMKHALAVALSVGCLIVSSLSINERYNGHEGIMFIYVSALVAFAAMVLVIVASARARDGERRAIILASAILFILCHVFVEIGVILSGRYYARYLPSSSMVLGMSPALLYLAVTYRLGRKSGRFNQLVFILFFLFSAIASVLSLFFMTDYLWMDFVMNNANVYAALSFVYMILVISGASVIIFIKKKALVFILIALALVLSFMMNILSFDKGSVIIRIMNHEFPSWWTRMSPVLYIKGFLFSTLGSYSIQYISLLLLLWNGIMGRLSDSDL